MSDQQENNQEPLKTNVILVVKGAGAQQTDTTLSSFLSGFLKAVRKFDENARVRIGPERQILSDYTHTPYFKNDEQKVAEIILEDKRDRDAKADEELKTLDPTREEEGAAAEKTKKPRVMRLWIKEAYWEPELAPASTFQSLLGEWRLTSYALIKLVERFLFPWHDVHRTGEDGTVTVEKNKRRYSFGSYYLYFALTHALVFGFLSQVGMWGASLLYPGAAIARSPGAYVLSLNDPVLHLAAFLGLALVTAVGPAWRSARLRQEEERTQRLPRMLGLDSWFPWALALALIFQPLSYLAALLSVLGLVASVLTARSLAWPKRADWYSDAAEKTSIHAEERSLARKDSRLARGTQLLYRFFVVVGVPVALAILVFANVFRILNLFGDAGTRIYNLIDDLIVQTFGDVTTYALDPEQAASVQHVLEHDIRTFATLKHKGEAQEGPEAEVVEKIHLFAHSQGTPISFEVLFHLLDEQERLKVGTYITIGSVLNLHNLANEVLDEVVWERFPPREFPEANRSFKWFNFWNLTDPITQFTGLDAYRYADLWVKKDGDLNRYSDGTPRLRYGKSSPFSIKTRESLLKNHSEYWSNVDEVHYPFLKRIFHGPQDPWLPQEWSSPSILERGKNPELFNVNPFDPAVFKKDKRTHRVFLLGYWLLFALVIAGLLVGLHSFGPAAADWLAGLIAPVTAPLYAWLADLIPDAFHMSFASLRELYLSQVVVNWIGAGLLLFSLLASLRHFGKNGS